MRGFFSIYVSFIKKVFVILLVSTMLFNIFVTKNQEFKNKFMVALDCAVNTIETAVLNEYTNKIFKAVNSIVQGMAIVTCGTVAEQQSNKTDNKQSAPVNSSSEEVIITKRISDTNISINFMKTKLMYSGSSAIKQLNNIYTIIEINSKIVASKIGILFFILFSIFIVRIKDGINNILKKENMEVNIKPTCAI